MKKPKHSECGTKRTATLSGLKLVVPFVMPDDEEGSEAAYKQYSDLMSLISISTNKPPSAEDGILQLESITRLQLETEFASQCVEPMPREAQEIYALEKVACWYLRRLAELARERGGYAVKAYADTLISGIGQLKELETIDAKAVSEAQGFMLNWPVTLRAGDRGEVPKNLGKAVEAFYGVDLTANKWSTRPIPKIAYRAVSTINMNRDIAALVFALEREAAMPEWVQDSYALAPLDATTAKAWGTAARKMIHACCPDYHYTKDNFPNQWGQAESEAAGGDFHEHVENKVLTAVVQRICTIAHKTAMPEKSAGNPA